MFNAGQSALMHRTQSAFPLSIGTSLALESIADGVQPPYDPEREKPPRVHLEDYSEFWINVSTLYRNLLGSLSRADAETVAPGDVLTTLIEELETIRDVVNQSSRGLTKVVFYRNQFRMMKLAHPNAKLRVAHTPKQLHYDDVHDRVLDRLYRDHEKDLGLIDVNRHLKPLNKPKALMLSHYAYDLLSFPEFTELDLLESHTGVLKRRVAYYTKFTNGANLANMPFNACTLQVFGDSQTFHPQPLALRQELVALSNQYAWHALTTKERLRVCFDFLKDRFAAEVLKSMLTE